jgi:hypothetical protein
MVYKLGFLLHTEHVSNYFNELENILDIKYNLKTKPHLIYNVDEKGISQNRTPPHIVGTVDNHPQAVTAGKSPTTTIIGFQQDQ